MKVILLTDVKKIGKKYDVKEVAHGFAQNFLIPQKKAIPATPGKIKWAEDSKKNAISEKEIQENLLAKDIEKIKKTIITIEGKVNDIGHLFAGIHEGDIAEALAKQADIFLSGDSIIIDKAIKEVGEHIIKVQSGKTSATFTLVVKAK